MLKDALRGPVCSGDSTFTFALALYLLKKWMKNISTTRAAVQTSLFCGWEDCTQCERSKGLHALSVALVVGRLHLQKRGWGCVLGRIHVKCRQPGWWNFLSQLPRSEVRWLGVVGFMFIFFKACIFQIKQYILPSYLLNETYLKTYLLPSTILFLNSIF